MAQCTKMEIVQLVLTDTGTYNPMQVRPYSATMSGVDVDRVIDRMQAANVSKVTPGLLAGVANSMVKPATNPLGEVIISNGWNENRLRFLLTVRCSFNGMGSDVYYYFQGYTNYRGIVESNVANSGQRFSGMAEDMEFIINSFTTASMVTMPTPLGLRTMSTIRGANQLLADPGWQGPTSTNSKYLMRPMDIYYGLQKNCLDGYQVDHNALSTDARSHMRTETQCSRRKNNLPTNYLASVIGGYASAASLADFGQSDYDIVNRAQEATFEDRAIDNPFIAAISNIRSRGTTNRFYAGDLTRIDPTIASNSAGLIKYTSSRGNRLMQVSQAGGAEYWNSTNRETIVATTLANAIPALMMENFIFSISVAATNHDFTGTPNISIPMAHDPSGNNVPERCENFKYRLLNEVLNDISFGNQDSYNILVTADLLGDIDIQISLSGGPLVRYVAPAWADTLYAPIVAPNQTYFQDMVQQMSDTSIQVSESLMGSTTSMPVAQRIF